MIGLPKPCCCSRRSSRALCSSTARNTPGGSDLTRGGAESCAPWQRLNFLPLPQGHGLLRPGRLLRDLLTLKIITGAGHQIVAEGQGRFHFVTGARPGKGFKRDSEFRSLLVLECRQVAGSNRGPATTCQQTGRSSSASEL